MEPGLSYLLVFNAQSVASSYPVFQIDGLISFASPVIAQRRVAFGVAQHLLAHLDFQFESFANHQAFQD